MEDMLPGNSFPQICVVSVNQSVEKRLIPQEYRGTVAQSNTPNYSLVNRHRVRSSRRFWNGWLLPGAVLGRDDFLAGPGRAIGIRPDEGALSHIPVIRSEKKRGSPASWTPCGGGTPSPDLRCFCRPFWRSSALRTVQYCSLFKIESIRYFRNRNICTTVTNLQDTNSQVLSKLCARQHQSKRSSCGVLNPKFFP